MNFEGFAVSLKRYPDTKPLDTKLLDTKLFDTKPPGARPLALFALVLSVFIGFFASPVQLLAQTQPTSQQAWRQIPIPKLPAFHPAQPKRIELPNGMVVFLQEDHELPTIDGTARIRGGERSIPANKTGMIDVYGEVWRTGGTKSQTGDQLDDFLEQRAAKVETGGDIDSTTVSWSCLKEDFDDVFRVFEDLLKNPEFRAEKIEIAQKGMYDGISRRNDDPTQIAGREAAKLVYGASNPYARSPEYATVAAITRQDLVEWHGRYVHPNNIILGVVGDFDSAKMEARLREAFASWPKGPAATDPEIKPDPAKPGYYEVDKTDVNQSNIQMVALGITRKNPDYFATSVFNEAFGGGFSSRLFNDIRTTKGLAYAVGGGVGAGWDHPGILRMTVRTKSTTTVESIQALAEEMGDLAKRPIDDTEIKRAKDAILNSFVFRFDSPEKVLQEKMAYEFYGYPLDFLENFQREIEKVTKEDVARVAAKYIHREQMAVLVVGNTKEFDKPLSSLGTVKKLDITIPPPPPGLVQNQDQGEHR
jgi:zinc protease